MFTYEWTDDGEDGNKIFCVCIYVYNCAFSKPSSKQIGTLLIDIVFIGQILVSLCFTSQDFYSVFTKWILLAQDLSQT